MSAEKITAIPAASAGARSEDDNIVIVSHRGPHDFVYEHGQWLARRSTGGLVSLLEPLARQPNVTWFCCVSEPAGCEPERHELFTTAKDQTDPELNVVPVPLPAALYAAYYGTISNGILWRAHHSLASFPGELAYEAEHHRAWEAYLQANQHLARAIAATELPVRAFLIQDYHLYPLSRMLRELYPGVPSLHFVHLPFPDPQRLRLLPRVWRQTLLEGLLGADIVGLQTEADVSSFLACCKVFLRAAIDHETAQVHLPSGRSVTVRALPASVDPDKIRALLSHAETGRAREALRSHFCEHTVVRVDRLDPVKNHILGFRAFGRLLELHPEWRGRVRFLAFVIPSRTDDGVFADYKESVYGQIDAVNERFRPAEGGDPIEVFYSHDHAQALAALEGCDVLLVNSRQESISLLAKEWAIASQKPGVLVVSETVGGSAEMENCGLLVCPLDVEGTAQALAQAITLPMEQRHQWLNRIRQHIEQWTAGDWLKAQLQALGFPALPEVLPSAPGASQTPRLEDSHFSECQVTIRNAEGIHARPAAAFVRCARAFQCQIDIVKDASTYSAKSILSVLTANLQRGSTFTLRATGHDAREALEQLSTLVETFAEAEAPLATGSSGSAAHN
jgi:trehalose 6-phosphate synthase